MSTKVQNLLKRNEVALFFLFVALFVLFSVVSRHFFEMGNIMNMFAQMVELGLLTIAMSASLISGGMDLSVGALCSLSTVLCATFIGVMGMPTWVSILIVFAVAVVCGAINGFLVGYLKVTSMLATLGTSSLFIGIGLVISKGVTIAIPTDRMEAFGRLKLGGFLPLQVLVFAAVILVAVIVFDYRIFGRRVYLIGSNPNAARFAGINLPRNLLLTYMFSACMAFVAALVMTSRVSSGRADIASSLVLRSVSAALLGGVSVLGGVGNIGGAVLGVAVITIVSNGTEMMNIPQSIQQVIVGCILLVVLAVRRGRRK